MTEDAQSSSTSPTTSPSDDTDQLAEAVKNTIAAINDKCNNPEFMGDISIDKMLSFVSTKFQEEFPIQKLKDVQSAQPVSIEQFLNNTLKLSKLFKSENIGIDLCDMEKIHKEMEKKTSPSISDLADSVAKNLQIIPDFLKGPIADMLKNTFSQLENSPTLSNTPSNPPDDSTSPTQSQL